MIEQFENKIINADCMDILKQLPDKCIDLVLTDPPYGIDYGGQLIKGEEFKFNTNKHGWRNFGNNKWDKERPSEEIFKEILRVSKNQIIWGGITLRTCCPLHKVGLFGIKDKEILALQMGNWHGKRSCIN